MWSLQITGAPKCSLTHPTMAALVSRGRSRFTKCPAPATTTTCAGPPIRGSLNCCRYTSASPGR